MKFTIKLPKKFKRSHLPTTILAILIFTAFALINSKSETEQPNKTESTNGYETAKVLKIIDGDTIEIDTGHKVRYIGIDTPETNHPTKKKECFGTEASAYNKNLVAGKEIRMIKDKSETDRYGRLLRYVYIDEIFINEELVRNGYAKAVAYSPDTKYQSEFQLAETYAKENNLGLWNTCNR